METESSGEAELTLEGGDCRVTIRGPEFPEDKTRWDAALKGAYAIWQQMHDKAHAARMAEIEASRPERSPGGGTGFMTETSAERRNNLLPGGTGALPA